MPDTDTNPSFYDNCWTHWENLKPVGATARHTRRIIKKLLKGLSVRNVLDVGCGDGLLLEKIHEQFPDADLNGTEYSPLAIEKTRQRFPKIHINHMDLSSEHLAEKFDLVLCIDVLEHIEDDLRALSHLKAMTGEYLLVAVPLGPLFDNERRYIGHVHGYSRKEFEQKLMTTGLRIIRKVQWGFPFYDLVRRLSQKSLAASPKESNRISWRQEIIWFILYYLYFFSIPGMGERYFALLKIDSD